MPTVLRTFRFLRRPIAVKRLSRVESVDTMKLHSHGFSMIEIMIAIAIIGIVMAVAVPNLSNVLRNSRITSVSNELLATFNFARSEAIKRRVDIVICNTPTGTSLTAPTITDCSDGGASWEQGWIVHVNDTATPDFTILRVQGPLTDNIDVQTNLTNLDLVEFNNRGFVSASNNFVFSICDDRGPETGKMLQIESTGRSRVAAFNDPSAVDCSL